MSVVPHFPGHRVPVFPTAATRKDPCCGHTKGKGFLSESENVPTVSTTIAVSRLPADINHLHNACSAAASHGAFSNQVVREICKHSVIYHKPTAYLQPQSNSFQCGSEIIISVGSIHFQTDTSSPHARSFPSSNIIQKVEAVFPRGDHSNVGESSMGCRSPSVSWLRLKKIARSKGGNQCSKGGSQCSKGGSPHSR